MPSRVQSQGRARGGAVETYDFAIFVATIVSFIVQAITSSALQRQLTHGTPIARV